MKSKEKIIEGMAFLQRCNEACQGVRRNEVSTLDLMNGGAEEKPCPQRNMLLPMLRLANPENSILTETNLVEYGFIFALSIAF